MSLIIGAVLIVAVVGVLVWYQHHVAERQQALAAMSPEERERELATDSEKLAALRFGAVNANLVCQHCTVIGHVRSKDVMRRTEALTGGIAKTKTTSTRRVAQRHCDNCNTTWDVA